MPNYKLLIEYDGTKFHGWQYQPRLRTVQGEIEDALATLLRKKVALVAAGRTDTGVHALGQVANFYTPEEILSLGGFLRSLNGLTGHDIAIKDIEVVPDTFNARFSARARQYAYQISVRPLAVGRQYVYVFTYPVNLELMRQASQMLLGEHRFEAFAPKIPGEKHYLCNVEYVEWHNEMPKLVFRIRANRFLHNMVRRVVGTLLLVGQGKMDLQLFAAMVEKQEKVNIAFSAPPHGLFLERVYY